MLSRIFAIACDGAYYVGLRAALNSIWSYHRRSVPVFIYYRDLDESQLAALQQHPCEIHLHELAELPFPSQGMWEAKQQVFAHCIGRARCVYLLDADLVLVSEVDDVFELAESGKIVSSADGSGVEYDSAYGIYSKRLPGARQVYINTGALCLDVVRHWDLAGLWAFASQYGAYSPSAGAPIGLPGYGDQGVFNAISALLSKTPDLHVLPEGAWCDSQQGCTVQVRQKLPDGRLDVWNVTDNTRQRLVHSSGPKWWTADGAAHLHQFGDKHFCFQHFTELAPVVRKPTILIAVCSSQKTANRRAAVRETWMRQTPNGVKALFFAGRGARNSEPDVVEVAAADDYDALPSKVHAFCRHAVATYEFDYLFKCDDDTYVVPSRLSDLAASGAAFVGSSVSAPDGYASGGAGYLLSRAAVAAVAQAPVPHAGAEDVWLTSVLLNSSFELTPSPHLRPGRDELPNPFNSVVTAHYCSGDEMQQVHRLMLPCADAVRLRAQVQARHAHWEGPIKLLSDGLFLGGSAAPDGSWEWEAATQSLILRWFHWPADHLQLRDWGLEGTNLRLEFKPGDGLSDWNRAMAAPISRSIATPRIFVRYNGRLGNQLFQFACGWVLANYCGVPLSADSIQGFPATRAFQYRRVPIHAMQTSSSDDMRLDLDACRQHLLDGGDVVLDGYHQRYEILRPRKRELKAMLSLQELPAPKSLPGANDLVVHVRLTDAFHAHNAHLFAYSCQETLEIIRRQLFDRLIVVTDEPAHPFIQQLQSEFVVILGQPDPLADFSIMMAARRLVLTPSTYSWWAAWLSNAEQIFFPRNRGIWRTHESIDLWVDDEPRYIAY